MTRYSIHSNIRTYKELESSLRVVQRQIEHNSLSQGVSQFKSNPSRIVKDIDWADVAVFVIRLLQNRLKK